MTNFERYRNEILEISKNGDRVAVDRRTKKVQSCSDVTCWNCVFYNGDAPCSAPLMLWLYEEYQEPSIDWSKVAVDTKVLVSNSGNYWCKRYFAKRKDGRYYTWYQGATSWSNDRMEAWYYAKLADGEDVE